MARVLSVLLDLAIVILILVIGLILITVSSGLQEPAPVLVLDSPAR